MLCATIKDGTECTFMVKNGCSYSGGRCVTVIEKCEGCGNVREFPAGAFCAVFANPASKWTLGRCNFATHLKSDVKKDEKKLNPLKAGNPLPGGSSLTRTGLSAYYSRLNCKEVNQLCYAQRSRMVPNVRSWPRPAARTAAAAA